MAKIVLGLGQKKSFRDVVAALELSLRESQGTPRQVTCWSDGIEILAKRGDYDGEFSTFSLKFPKDYAGLDKLVEKADANKEACEHRADGDTHLFLSPPRGKSDYVLAKSFVDEFSTVLAIPEIWRAEGAKYRIDPISVELLFQAMVQYKASDCHLSPGDAPVFRIDNRTRHSELMSPLSAEQIRNLVEQMAPADDWNEFLSNKQCSFSFHQVGIGYARVSAFIKTGAPHLTLRFLPETIPSFEDLQIPSDTMTELASLHRGLVLVTGMTGSGKTTTSAALVDWINTHRQCHILTLENPVEYVHHNKKAIISQRSL
ncbi:MAG: ATPase, T2SS/T4P/T4SS family, partial [Candidatus Hydrogenedentales bacterium]